MKTPFCWRLGEGPERRDNARSPICGRVQVNVNSELIRVKVRFVDQLLCTMANARIMATCCILCVMHLLQQMRSGIKEKRPSKFEGQRLIFNTDIQS
ncbi:hypothetical protein CDAR_425301 [Caerostris darwini]|uniref:Uncharacterized protein n=1 Tax=Caerostris darwini TaxID=1538125 RepID=A0AAV4UN05_9ARAC|nr:hypothetical protein CDAR_425301 [Caerostris darwini]